MNKLFIAAATLGLLSTASLAEQGNRDSQGYETQTGSVMVRETNVRAVYAVGATSTKALMPLERVDAQPDGGHGHGR
jgi:hypothetical protein